MPETVIADSPWSVNALTYDGGELRRQLSSLLVHDGSAVSAMPGVLHGLSMSGTALTATCAAGAAVVTPVVGSAGSYLASVGVNTAVTLAARDATNPRRDRAVLRLYDADVTGGSRKEAVVEVVTGTPASSPIAPAIPAGTLPLGSALVPTSGTVIWTDERPFTAALGGTIPCTSSTRPAGAWLRPGQSIFETDTGRLRVWTGSAWSLVAFPATGAVIPDPITTAEATWTVGDVTQRAYVGPSGMAELRIDLRTNATKTPAASGALTGDTVATLKPEWYPRNNVFGTFQYRNGESSGGQPGGQFAIYENGTIRLLSICPGTSIGAQATGTYSIRLSAQYYLAGTY